VVYLLHHSHVAERYLRSLRDVFCWGDECRVATRKVKKHTTDKWDEPRLPGGQAFCGLAVAVLQINVRQR